MYPSAMVDPDAINGGEYRAQGIVGDERRWEDLCCYISLHLPRLAHLGEGFHFNTNLCSIFSWVASNSGAITPIILSNHGIRG